MANIKMPSAQTLKDWGDKLQASVIFGIKVFIFLLFLVLFPYMVMELFRDDLIIQPFEVPLELAEKQGYSGKVVAHRLQGYMDELRDQLERSSTLKTHQGMAAVQSTEFATQEIDVPTLGLSVNAIVSQIRWLLGLGQHQLNGDLVIRDNQLHLTIRITSQQPKTLSADKNVQNLEPLIKKAAEYVLKTVEPLLFGNNYCLNQKDELLAALIDEVQQSQMSRQEPAVALMLESYLLKNQKKYEPALEKLTQAEQYDPTNPRIFLMKGNTLLESDEPNDAIDAYKTALKHDPNNGGIYSKLAEAFIKIGKIDKAVRQYERASKKDPHNPSIYTNWGEQLTEKAIRCLANDNADAAKEEFEKAETQFKRALQEAPSYALAYAAWGKALLHQKAYRAASDKYETAVKFDPTIAWFYGNWGIALVNLKESKKALETFAKSLALKQTNWVYPELVKALKNLKKPELFERYKEVALKLGRGASYYEKWGTVLASLAQYEAAIAKYQQALEMKPDEGFYYFRWGNVLIDLMDYEQALVKYKQAIPLLKRKSTQAWTYSGWGNALVGLKRYEEALVKYEEALNLKHRKAVLVYNDLLTALEKLNKPEYFAQYEPIIEKSQENRLKWRYYYVYGRTLAALGQYEPAIVQYNKALEVDSTYVWSRIWLGYALIKVQKPEKALTQCEEVLKSTSASDTAQSAAHALCGLAQIQLNQPEKILKSCQTALTLSEKEDWAYWCLGDVLILQGKPDEAVTQYEAAVKLKPENAFYYYKLGQILAVMKQNEAALTQYQKAVELDKTGEIGKQAQAHIDALKETASGIDAVVEDGLPEGSTPSDKAAAPLDDSTPSK